MRILKRVLPLMIGLAISPLSLANEGSGFRQDTSSMTGAKRKDGRRLAGQDPEADSEDRDKNKLRLANEAADRFMDRLLETLDFTTVWNEMFVQDEAIRKIGALRCLNLAAGRAVDAKMSGLDESSQIRFYVAFSEFFTLALGYTIRTTDFQTGESESVEERESFFNEIKDLPGFSDAEAGKIAEGLEKMQANISPEEFKELFDRTIPPLEAIIPLMRTQLLRKPDSATYRANLAYARQAFSEAEPRVQHGLAGYPIPDDVEVYVVDRLFFRLYLIETDGDLRLVACDIVVD